MEVDQRRGWAADAADDGAEEERVGLDVGAAGGGGREGAHPLEHVEGDGEEAAAVAAEAEAGVEELEVWPAGPREDVVDEVLGGDGALPGGGGGEGGEVGGRGVAEARAERGPAEEREREVRVLLGVDGVGQVARGEARAEARDPRRELLVRRRADGGLRVPDGDGRGLGVPKRGGGRGGGEAVGI